MRHRPTAVNLSKSIAFSLTLFAAGSAWAQQFDEQTSARFPTAANEYTNQLTVGDLDGDDDLDIIWANGGGFNSPAALPSRSRLYLNDGSGVFTDATTGNLGASGYARGVELGDIDGDGDLDLLIAHDFNRQPQLFVNDGNASFTNVTGAQLPAITLSSSRGQFGDIDNDGDLDIYITNGGSTNRFGCGQYQVWVNDGNGTFSDETASRHPLGCVNNNMDCIFGDIDGDFDLDVRTASTGSNNSRLYRNDGTGVFTVVGGVPADSSCYSYDFGDMDGDGDLDLLGANGNSGSTEMLMENDGSGTYTNVSGQISPNVNQDDNDTKFFDRDNDGDLDMLIGRIGGPEKIFDNDGNGNFTQTSGVIQLVSDSTLDIMVADLDNDGDLDILTAQGESGTFTNRIYINVDGPPDTIAPRVHDTEQHADTTDTAGPYVVRAAILDDMSSDRNFFDKGVELNYTVGPGPTLQVPMSHSGGQIYRAEIPGQQAGSEVPYFVTATDWNDNTGAGDAKMFSVLCSEDGGGLPGDVDGDCVVGIEDFLAVLGNWGDCPEPCPPTCFADLNRDCQVGIEDFLLVLGNWTL